MEMEAEKGGSHFYLSRVAGTLSGCVVLMMLSGGVASLNPRLMAGTPPGCEKLESTRCKVASEQAGDLLSAAKRSSSSKQARGVLKTAKHHAIPVQAGGLPAISRGSEHSGDPRNLDTKNPHPEGVPDSRVMFKGAHNRY